eukprot:TRINITY_DN1268_c0_g1_i1.p1 TRINITY_DN1268_c0_g1~~TRINITY_DN1268_c0_g1_i1.p1  ORF type:complete len:423 (+),score=82.12 TRINITY_DN1268_c0_g1_i1:2-1270(+)
MKRSRLPLPLFVLIWLHFVFGHGDGDYENVGLEMAVKMIHPDSVRIYVVSESTVTCLLSDSLVTLSSSSLNIDWNEIKEFKTAERVIASTWVADFSDLTPNNVFHVTCCTSLQCATPFSITTLSNDRMFRERQESSESTDESVSSTTDIPSTTGDSDSSSSETPSTTSTQATSTSQTSSSQALTSSTSVAPSASRGSDSPSCDCINSRNDAMSFILSDQSASTNSSAPRIKLCVIARYDEDDTSMSIQLTAGGLAAYGSYALHTGCTSFGDSCGGCASDSSSPRYLLTFDVDGQGFADRKYNLSNVVNIFSTLVLTPDSSCDILFQTADIAFYVSIPSDSRCSNFRATTDEKPTPADNVNTVIQTHTVDGSVWSLVAIPIVGLLSTILGFVGWRMMKKKMDAEVESKLLERDRIPAAPPAAP